MTEKDLKALKIDRSRRAPGAGRAWMLVASAALVVGFVLVAYLFMPAREAPEPIRVAADSEVSEPVPDTSNEVLIVSGYVVAHHKIDIGSKVMGKVAWVGVEKGDRVREGQLLVRLDDREYRARLNEARAGRQAAAARLAELEAGYRPEEIERAEAELERSRAELANARLELERLERLLAEEVVSRQEVDNARARRDIARAAVKVAEKNLRLMQLGPRKEQIEQARADLARAEASVKYAATLLEATEIRAPVTGTVLERIVEVGEMVTTSFAGERGAKSSVVSLADLNDLQVELDISQADFNLISNDQACLMTPEAYPDRHYECTIDEISPEADRQKATIQVKVKVLEPDEFLRPEMTAQVKFLKPLREQDEE